MIKYLFNICVNIASADEEHAGKLWHFFRCEFLKDFVDLCGKLPDGADDDGSDVKGAQRRRKGQKFLNDRNDEGQSLATACHSFYGHIFAAQKEGNG